MWKAKQEFLWYKKDDIINQEDLIHIEKYERDGLVYNNEEKIIIEEPIVEEEIKEEIIVPVKKFGRPLKYK